MATKIGDLYFEVSASTEKISKSILGIGNAAKDSGNIVSLAIGGAFVAAGVAATTALASITAGLAAVGVEFNAAGQRATGLFTALTGSAEEAVALMREFAEVSLNTPIFTAKALQDVSRTLLAYGVAKDDVVDLAVAIQSTATALGVGELGAHKLALALGQVKSRGFFSAEEARQLANYGVNAYGLIAEAVGKSVSEVRELGKQHKLLSEDVLPILTEKLQTTFGPVAQSLVNTLGVQIQGLKNTLTGFASALVEPFVGRTGGGAVVEFLAAIRSELEGVVTVGEDGTFRLGGALESLNVLTQALADGFLELGYSILDAFGSGAGGGGFSSFITDVADAIPVLVQATKDFASGAAEFFGDLLDAAEPLFDPIKNLVLILGDFVINALPAAADAVVNFVDAAAPIAATLITITDLLLQFASPIVVGVIDDLAGVFADLADVVDALGGPLLVVYGALGSIAFLATSSGGLGVLAVQGLALAFASLAAKVILAVGALETYKALAAGTKSLGGNTNARDDFLFGDPSNPIEGVFQKAGQIGRGFVIGSGQVALEDFTHDLLEMNEVAKEVGSTFADSFKHSGLSAAEFEDQIESAGLSTYEAAYATGAYRDILNEVQQANVEAGIATSGMAADLFEARVAAAAATGGFTDFGDAIEEDIDYIKIFGEVAKMAWEEVDRLQRPSAGETLDQYLAGLVDTAKDVTDAMAETGPAIIRNLDVNVALGKASQDARAIIRKLAEDYHMSMDSIRALFDKRGLQGILDALPEITEEVTKSVDPLIAKYGQLGATADQLRDAIARLNDQRQTAIKAQIDQVEAALRDAKEAAVEARQAIIDFFTGGQPSGTQKLIDELIGDVGDIGSKIEAGLLLGGEQGAAAIRLALGDIQGQLAGIVTAGLEDGLTGQQIVDMLGPLGTVLGEQANQALNRISSLDWTEGFTPAAGAEIANLLMSVLDPGAIQKLLNDAMGADATVSGLEKQLEDLKAAADVEVEFSASQVQGALDDIAQETKLTVEKTVISPEARDALEEAINNELNDPTNPFAVAIDRAVIADQILQAAQDAQNQIKLIFESGLSFDSTELDMIARQVSTEFYAAFNNQLEQLRDLQAQAAGFRDYPSMVAALGPAVANATLSGAALPPPVVNVDVPVTVNGNLPVAIETGTQRVSANGTAAGSNGSLSRSLQEIYGYRPLTRTGPA